MRIEREEVEQVARLARLALTAPEIETITGQLDRILGYVAQLNELDTADVEPTSHVVPLETRLREDRAGNPLSPEQALAEAPDRKGAFFRVPKILE